MGNNTRGVSNESLIGKQFGAWKVIGIADNVKLRCKCSCGIEKDVNKYTLLDGRSTNCGHLKNRDRVLDLTGQVFGELKVVRYLGYQYWECECSCGSICKKHRNHLLDGRATHCGHLRDKGFKDIKGQKFGKLTAIQYVGNKNWLCKCDCGNTKVIAGANLRNKSTVSCGCIQKHISIEEIEEFVRKFTEENDRLPFIDELAKGFENTYDSMWYFINKLDAKRFVNCRYSSVGEREVAELFKGIENRILCDKRLIPPYELDILLPEHRLAIEYNGSYWHSELRKNSRYHQLKTVACSKKGVQLIHIFEYEWNNEDTKRKIKSYLKDKVYGVTKIYARNTVVKEIRYEESSKFLDLYHLQGSVPAKINIGCYRDDELIGVLTLGKPRFNNNAEYEIIRLCFKSGIGVIGGAEKMFTYFRKVYKPKSVVTYADLAKFRGDVYIRMGFRCEKVTEPSYVWWNKSNREVKSRYMAQKGKLVNSGMGTEDETEEDIMYRLGYSKIFNAGSLRFIWLDSNEKEQ